MLDQAEAKRRLNEMSQQYPEKFLPIDRVFDKIHRGARIFVGTACGEPQYLSSALIEYVRSNPKAFFDAEVFHVWSLGIAPYADDRFRHNFRHNSFFIGQTTREAINRGAADYTPLFLSQVPDMFYRRRVPIDVALIQTSPPDSHGYMSLGISVDIVKAATEVADLVIAQVNKRMPRTHGDGFIHIRDVDYLVPYDEELLEFHTELDNEAIQAIAKNVAQLVEDGDTIQVGYGATPNAIIANLRTKQHLGVHTELISDGIVELMKLGVIDNSRKTVNRGKAVTTFCMGHRDTYEFLHDNPAVEFRTIDYTNDPRVIAQHDHMVAINAALEIDLTGQATAESIGHVFFSSVGGQADFMRGAVLARNGRSILTLPSTALNGTVSRIVPFLKEGAGVTLVRGDIHYVVTEYGIAYLHGKNIRERAMELISIAHPDFRSQLIDEAKKHNLIYADQAFIPGKRGEYPAELERITVTSKGFECHFRPVNIDDEPLLKDFFYSLSDNSMYRRFISARKDMPHERLQEFVVIDYTREMVILAIVHENNKEVVIAVGQYGINPGTHTAEVSFAVRDSYHNRGIGSALLEYLTFLAKRQGLLGFTAEVLVENKPMLHVFEKAFPDLVKSVSEGLYELKMTFRTAK